METIVMYLIYVLGIVAALAVIGLVLIKIKSMEIKKDVIEILTSKGYESENIDLQKYIK